MNLLRMHVGKLLQNSENQLFALSSVRMRTETNTCFWPGTPIKNNLRLCHTCQNFIPTTHTNWCRFSPNNTIGHRKFSRSSRRTQNSRQKQDSLMYVFDREAKNIQRERAARAPDVELFDYLKHEVGYRLADRIFDIKRKFSRVANLGCGRGYVAKNVSSECVGELILCDSSQTWLEQAVEPEDQQVKVTRKVVDEEKLPFEPSSLDLVISSLSLHWVNDLPGTFSQIISCLKNDGVFLAAVFGGDTLYELRSSLQLAELEREGGIAPHISPFTEIRDIGSLLTRAGFTMQTVDVDEIVVGYPGAFQLMSDLKGMGENNAAFNRKLRLNKDTMMAAAAIYQELYGKIEDGTTKVPATFQVIYMLGWKPDKSQPAPLDRGSGDVSLKDLYRLDEIISETKKVPLDEPKKKPRDSS